MRWRRQLLGRARRVGVRGLRFGRGASRWGRPTGECALAPDPSRGESSTLIQTSNLLLLPVYGGAALGAALAALTGLNLDIASTTAPGFNEPPKMSWVLTPVLALAAVALLVVRLRRGRPGPDLWVFLATLTAFCLVIGLSVGPDRPPTATRYVFPGAVISLLVVVEAARGVGFSRRVLVVGR